MNRRMLSAVIAGLFMIVGQSASASPPQARQPVPGTTQTRAFSSPECEQALQKANAKRRMAERISKDECLRTSELVVSEAIQATPADILADNPTAPESLLRAAAVGGVYYTYYRYSISQVTDKETLVGRFYFDQYYSWISTTYRGAQGYTDCWVDYTYGYSIDILRCTGGGLSSGTNSSNMRLYVTLLKVTPVSWTENYYVYFNRFGGYWT